MILYHATPKRNLDGIRKHGLDPKRATGKVKGVWLHTESKQALAILHTIKRHGLQSFDEPDRDLIRNDIEEDVFFRFW